jgi:hypothetical protein
VAYGKVGRRYRGAVAGELQIDPDEVSSRLTQARRRGLYTSVGRGLDGARLTPRAIEALGAAGEDVGEPALHPFLPEEAAT